MCGTRRPASCRRQRPESLFKIFSGPPPARYARTRSATTGWVIVQAWALYAALPSTESLKEPLHEKLSLDPGRHFRSCRNPGGLRCAQPRCWRVKHPSRPAPRGWPMQCCASAVVCGQRLHRQRDRGGAGAVGCPHGAGVAPRQMITKEYNAQRLSLVVDDNGRITAVRCG